MNLQDMQGTKKVKWRQEKTSESKTRKKVAEKEGGKLEQALMVAMTREERTMRKQE